MLAILSTHPIQYQVPVWQELARRGEMPFEVWYLSDHGYREGLDRGFGKIFSWDLDMLGGYPYRFLPTHPAKADIHAFLGARIGSLSSLFRRLHVSGLLINGWFPQAYWQAAFQAHRAGIPVLLRAETNDLRKMARWKEMCKRVLLTLLFHRISVFLTVGIANRRFYQRYGVPESRLNSSPYCIDNGRFALAAQEFRSQRFSLRERWGISPDAVCFLFSGKLVSKKRPEDLLRAFEILLLKPREFGLSEQQIHLLVVGDGAMRISLGEKVKKLNKMKGRPCVTFTGFLNQTEMPKAYAVADCLVLPSDSSESWGLVVNEAMACGLTCIVSDQVGCGPDLIDPGITGDVFPMGDIGELAAAMARWCEPARILMARPAVKEKISHYSIGQAVDGILHGINTACGRSNLWICRSRTAPIPQNKNG